MRHCSCILRSSFFVLAFFVLVFLFAKIKQIIDMRKILGNQTVVSINFPEYDIDETPQTDPTLLSGLVGEAKLYI